MLESQSNSNKSNNSNIFIIQLINNAGELTLFVRGYGVRAGSDGFDGPIEEAVCRIEIGRQGNVNVRLLFIIRTALRMNEMLIRLILL